MSPLPELNVDILCNEAKAFAELESTIDESELYGVNNGKAVGTYIELKFTNHLASKYLFTRGNAASGIDIPDLEVDIKVTSIKKPQSSCPLRSPRQKVYGLGYSLIIFVYDKKDDDDHKTSRLNFLHVIFVSAEQTSDFQLTSRLLNIVQNKGNQDDILACFEEHDLPISPETEELAEEVLAKTPSQGYLTISNALQWRLAYSRVIKEAGTVAGIKKVL